LFTSFPIAIINLGGFLFNSLNNSNLEIIKEVNLLFKETKLEVLKETDKIILYIYSKGCCDSEVIVVFKRNNILFIVDDSHCGCNPFQIWNPIEFSIEELEDYKVVGGKGYGFPLWKAVSEKLERETE
jgi:hypothetical protein